jgi:hypothetical protein
MSWSAHCPLWVIRWGNRPAACGLLKILGAALQADGGNEVRVYGLKHQKEKRSMDHFAGLDVSVKETSVCNMIHLKKHHTPRSSRRS